MSAVVTKKPVKAERTVNRIVDHLQALRRTKGQVGMIEVCSSTNNVLSDVKYVLRTDLEPFDELVGGIPFGRVGEVFGTEACGKTELCKHICRMGQAGRIYKRTRQLDQSFNFEKLDPDTYEVSVLFIDNEQSLEEGMVPEDWAVARCETIELLFKTVDRTMQLLVKIQEETKKLQFLIVVVDTIAGTSSKEELTAEWGKDDYARQPKQLREGFRNMIQQINRQNVAMICTNQVSDKIGYVDMSKGTSLSPNHNKFSAFGGKALAYWSSYRIFMFQMPMKYSLIRGAQFRAGYLIGFKTVKNRFKMPEREARLVLLFDPNNGGFRNDLSILETLLFFKFAEFDAESTENGELIFKFKRNGIELKTFGEAPQPTLEEQDTEDKKKPARYKDPRIVSRAEWPAFYQAHKADFDALWMKSVEHAFTVQGINGIEQSAEEEVGEASEEAEPVSDIPRKARAGRRTSAALPEV
jgi:RecA/RadA recombinase